MGKKYLKEGIFLGDHFCYFMPNIYLIKSVSVFMGITISWTNIKYRCGVGAGKEKQGALDRDGLG
jgi:hypothetical protein